MIIITFIYYYSSNKNGINNYKNNATKAIVSDYIVNCYCVTLFKNVYKT